MNNNEVRVKFTVIKLSPGKKILSIHVQVSDSYVYTP